MTFSTVGNDDSQVAWPSYPSKRCLIPYLVTHTAHASSTRKKIKSEGLTGSPTHTLGAWGIQHVANRSDHRFQHQHCHDRNLSRLLAISRCDRKPRQDGCKFVGDVDVVRARAATGCINGGFGFLSRCRRTGTTPRYQLGSDNVAAAWKDPATNSRQPERIMLLAQGITRIDSG